MIVYIYKLDYSSVAGPWATYVIVISLPGGDHFTHWCWAYANLLHFGWCDTNIQDRPPGYVYLLPIYVGNTTALIYDQHYLRHKVWHKYYFRLCCILRASKAIHTLRSIFNWRTAARIDGAFEKHQPTFWIRPATWLHFVHEIADPISRSPQCNWWGLVLAETHPAQWVTLFDI